MVSLSSKIRLIFFIFIVCCFPILTGMGKGRDIPPEEKAIQRHSIGVATFVDHIVLNLVRDGFLEGLKKANYTQENGWDIIILNANGDPVAAAAVANDLLNLQPDILVSITTPATKPLFEKNNGRLPLVFTFVSFPDKIGITEESKNVTGLSDAVNFKAIINLTQEVIPNLERIGMVFSDQPEAIASFERMQKITKNMGLKLLSQSVSKEEEVRSATEILLRLPIEKRPQALIVGADGLVTNKITALVDVATSAKVPVFAADEGSVEKGAVAALSVNYYEFGKETAKVVDRVLKGVSPDEIPLSQYMGNDLLINEATAHKIGLNLPNSIIKIAIKVIR